MTQHQSQRRCTWGRARQCGRLHSLQTRLASGCGEIFTNGRTGSTSRRTLWTVPRVSRDRTVAALQRAAPALRQFIEGKFTLLARATPIPTRLSERAHYYCIEGLMECLEGVDRRFAAKKGSGHRRLCAHDHPDWQHHQDTSGLSVRLCGGSSATHTARRVSPRHTSRRPVPPQSQIKERHHPNIGGASSKLVMVPEADWCDQLVDGSDKETLWMHKHTELKAAVAKNGTIPDSECTRKHRVQA